MSDNFKFPTDTCVLVCSGPSLNLVDPFSLGLPVVAVSTAIRKITNPHYWILADYLNDMHGSEGNVAYQNENILKVIPNGKINPRHSQLIRNSLEVQYSDSDRTINDINSHLFSKRLPLLKGPHKSATFAIQWLHHVGVKNVIWVGNDLNATSAQTKYAYDSNATDLRKAHNYNSTLDQVHQSLKNWYPKAKQLGYNWYSWKCGDIFEQFVEKFDETNFSLPENQHFYTPVEKSIHEINTNTHLQKVVSPKLRKEERKKLQKFRKENVLNLEEKKKINKERILNQAKKKTEELEVKRNTTKIVNTPKTPVNNKKYPKYVSIPKTKKNIENSIKKIKDSLR
jgi:hypothetical protein